MFFRALYTKKFKQRKKRLVNVFSRAVYEEIQTKEKKLVNMFTWAVSKKFKRKKKTCECVYASFIQRNPTLYLIRFIQNLI